MRRLKLLTGWLALAFAAAGSAAAQTAPTEPVEARMEAALSALRPPAQVEGRTYPDQTLAEMMRYYRVPAVSIAYVENGRIAWAGAFGMADVAANRAATTETLFQAASISKPVAATAALALVDGGRLSLDRPVNEQLTSWHIPDNELTREAPVTLRHLLTHTGGVTVHGFPGYEAGAAVPTRIQILGGTPPANTEAVRVDQRPGSAWRYSGGGYTILEQLMSDVAGEPFPALMERLVLRPVGMTQSSFGPLSEERRARAASGYRPDGAAVPGGSYIHPELAAAGLWTTASDLARWAIALDRAHDGAGDAPVRPETARAMLTPGLGDWGLGMAVRGEGEWRRFSHGGANQGFRAEFVYFPERDEGIFILTNSDNGPNLFVPIMQAVGRARGWPQSEPRMIAAGAATPQSLDDAVGRYGNGDIAIDVARDGERLMMSLQGAPAGELVPLREDVYLFIDMGFEVTFARDPASGRIVSASGAGVTLPRLP